MIEFEISPTAVAQRASALRLIDHARQHLLDGMTLDDFRHGNGIGDKAAISLLGGAIRFVVLSGDMKIPAAFWDAVRRL